MAEPLTTALIAEQLGKLRVAFPNTRDSRSPAVVADLYRDHLAGVSAEALRAAVTRVIREDEFFPKVARLRAVAFEVEAARERERRSHDIASSHDDEQLCPNCRVTYYPTTHYAPKMLRAENGQLYPELTADGLLVVLEPRQRIVCDCTTKSLWQPIAGSNPPCAPANTLLKYHLDQLFRARHPIVCGVPAIPSATSSAA
jgi:hypothetical protein